MAEYDDILKLTATQ